MKLPFFSKHIGNNEYYLGLLLQENKVTGFVFEMRGANISIIAQHSAKYSNGWDSILEDVDDILFRLETDSSKKIKKTIFFVSSIFVDDTTKEIKREFKMVIKKLVKQLELQPLGFIECYEAVAALLTEKEGVQLNAVLIELDKVHANVFIYKNGKKMHTASITRTDNLMHDLTTVFKEMQGLFLMPARMVLFPFAESHRELVHLINHKWDQEIFVQIPRVEVINEDDFDTGLSHVFASQITDEKSDIVGNPSDTKKKAIAPQEDFQIQEAKSIDFASPAHVEASVSSVPQKVMGFVVGGQSIVDNTPSDEEQAVYYPKQNSLKHKLAPLAFFNAVKLPKLKMKTKLLMGIVGILIILLFLGGITEYFFHKVTIQVSFPSKQLTKTLNITSEDIAIKTGSISADVTKSKVTTGKRDIGEKAKGEVTINNFDDKDKVISKGSILEAGGKTFTLDQDVKVSSSTFNLDSTAKLPGKVKANISAVAIGADSNEDKATKFSIQGLSSSLFFALSETALSGGTKRQARTVAKKDMDDLQAQALDEGKKQGLDELRQKTSSEEQLIDSLTTQNAGNISFSKEVGDEVDELKLKATVNTTYFSYPATQLKQFIKKSLDADVPAGFVLPIEKIDYIIKDAANKNKISLSVDATGTALKQVSKQSLQTELAGKSPSKAQEILKSKYNATAHRVISSNPTFFPFSMWLPMFKKNITININTL